MGTVKPSKGFLKGAKGLHLLWRVVLVLLKASKRVSKAFEGIQRLSMEPPKGFRGFWRASWALWSLPNATDRTKLPTDKPLLLGLSAA